MRTGFFLLWLLLFTPALLAECRPAYSSSVINPEQLRHDLEILASDEMRGRKSGKEGARLARNFIAERFYQSGLLTSDVKKALAPNDYFSEFTLKGLFSDKTGVNVVAVVPGQRYPKDVIVFTAHYDHLGVQKGKVYPGADDNASGVSALLAMAQRASKSPPQHTHIFVATEYEEQGLYGAKAFVAKPPVPLDRIKLNINLDMLSQPGIRHKLYIAGTGESPWLATLLDTVVSARNCVVFGHDGRTRSRDGQGYIDWRKSSDHWAFISQNIPYLFLGVGEHRYYHQPSDTAQQVNWPFYFHAVQTLDEIVTRLDQYQFRH